MSDLDRSSRLRTRRWVLAGAVSFILGAFFYLEAAADADCFDLPAGQCPTRLSELLGMSPLSAVRDIEFFAAIALLFIALLCGGRLLVAWLDRPISKDRQPNVR